MRALVIAAVIMAAQFVLIHRYPDPRWVLLTLAVPALFVGLTISSVKAVVGGRRGGARR